jgi:deoxyadenosine/deoxycytidine kinase
MSGPLIAVVGVCAAGKSTLVHALRELGFNARQVSQEHSYVQDMWLRFTKPDLLIFLDVQLQTIRRRRQDPEWPDWLLDRERQRLQHARRHCDLYLATDDMTPEEVLQKASDLLARRGAGSGT